MAYALAQRRRSAFVANAVAVASALGLALVVAPDLANLLANAVGIGRGADLIIYVFIVVVLAAIFNLHLRLRAEREVTTRVVRELALNNARKPSE
ncbi:MAG: DUF2304 domain-containing protein [Devosia sp.]|nr:DUF2304 domain-containing protein [Devosia sp.]